MAKLKIKNSINNSLISFLKEQKIRFDTKNLTDGAQRVIFFPNSEKNYNNLLGFLQTYGSNLYHDCNLQIDLSVDPIFNYLSNQYENITANENILNLPLYYLENINEQNKNNSNLKSLQSNKVNKNYILQISNNQISLAGKTIQQINKNQ